MYKLKLVLSFVVFSFCVYAQKWEIGGGLGVSNTRSDISYFNFLNTRYAATAFLRYNINYAWVIKADLKYFSLYGSDKNNSDTISTIRNYAFAANGGHFSANMEYNFLDYRDLKHKVKFSPFLTAGIGLCYFRLSNSDLSVLSPIIPFGFGVKYMVSKNWNIGLLFETSKTFTDKLDGLDSTLPLEIDPHIKSADLATDDWYHFFGLTISYTFYHIKCPDHHDRLIKQELVPSKKDGN